MPTLSFRRALSCFSLISLFASAATAAGTTALEIGSEKVELEIASTAIEQRTGLMNRNYLADMNSVEAMEFLKDRLEKTVSNEEFFATMNGDKLQ